MSKQICPLCRQSVDVEHNGKQPMNDDRDSPWLMVEHVRTVDVYGDTRRETCPGSGKNQWSAENSW